MAIRNIVKDTDEYNMLHKKCRPVTDFNQKLWDLLDDMAETMYKAEGVALPGRRSACSEGCLSSTSATGFWNLSILKSWKLPRAERRRGVPFLPGEYGLVERPNYVKVRAQNRNGEWFEMEGEALFARAVCHENDHLDGVVFKDRMSRLLREDELGE